jgi:hypothetical protein
MLLITREMRGDEAEFVGLVRTGKRMFSGVEGVLAATGGTG